MKHKPQNPSSTMEMWKLREQAKMQAEEVVAPPDRDEVSLETQEELNRELDEINSLGVSKEAEYTQASFFFDQNGQASFGVKQSEKNQTQ